MLSTNPRFLCIGYISKTRMVSGGEEFTYVGGPSLNVGRVLSALDCDVSIISPYGPQVEDKVPDIMRSGINTRGLWRTSSTFELIIDKEASPPLIVSISDPITIDRVNPSFFDIPNVYLGPVISEIPDNTVLSLAKEMSGSRFFLDAQGYTRKFQGPMKPDENLSWDNKGELIGLFDAVKLNERELGLVMGSATENSLRDLGSMMKRDSVLILTRGEMGSSLYRNGVVTHIDPVAVEGVVDTTCAGDSYMGAFLAEYCRTGDYIEAARFASRYSSNVVQEMGFASFRKDEI